MVLPTSPYVYRRHHDHIFYCFSLERNAWIGRHGKMYNVLVSPLRKPIPFEPTITCKSHGRYGIHDCQETVRYCILRSLSPLVDYHFIVITAGLGLDFWSDLAKTKTYGHKPNCTLKTHSEYRSNINFNTLSIFKTYSLTHFNRLTAFAIQRHIIVD